MNRVDNLGQSSELELDVFQTPERPDVFHGPPKTLEDEGELGKQSSVVKMAIKQMSLLSLLCFGQLCLAATVSLQAPFFPREAERKGASATVYGLVFGAFEMAVIVFSPVLAKLVFWVDPRFLILSGLFVSGCCNILFGFIDRSPGGSAFIGLAFAIRILEGIAYTAATTGTYSLGGQEFQNKAATVFSLFGSFFGVGLIVGPSIGGLLYEVQGFPLPFYVMGSLVLLTAAAAWFLVPTTKVKPKSSGNLFSFLYHPSTILDAFSIITSLMFIGFYATTLEPYTRQFGIRPALLGLLFVITGTIHGLTSPMWGHLCNKGADAKLFTIGGYLMMCISLLMLGPAPFIQVTPKLWNIILALVIAGFGLTAKIVCGLVDALQDALDRGFPNDFTTHGMVSALYTTSCSIGAFAGPSLAGVLWDSVGFRYGSMVFLAFEVIFLSLSIMNYIFKSAPKKDQNAEDVSLRQ